MGSAVHVEVQGLRELRADLKRIDATLPRELNTRLKTATEPVRALAAAKAPHRLGKLAASVKLRTGGSRLFLASSLPYAKIVHFGGRHPVYGNRNNWVTVKARPFMQQAITAKADTVERQVADTVENLMASAGFH